MAAEVDCGLGGNVFGEVNIGAQALVLAEVVCGLGMNKLRQIDFIFRDFTFLGELFYLDLFTTLFGKVGVLSAGHVAKFL